MGRSCQVILLALVCGACGSSAPHAVTPSTVVVPAEKERAVEGEPVPDASPPEPERTLPACQASSDESALEQARKLFREGVELYERGEYGAAASAFKESYELSCKTPLLSNIARAYEQLGDVEGAIATYERLLQVAEPNDPLIENAKRRVEELKKRR